MAMFDIGKRGSGSQQDQKDQKNENEGFFKDLEKPREGLVSPPGAGIGRSRDAAVVGPSIHIEGTLSGEEDLIIEGRVNGTVKLQGHSLTVGSHGQINADIYAHTVVVDGTVEGDLFGAERVVIRKSADIRGNITSPRVSLEEGARFKGAIEMDPQVVEDAMGKPKSGTSAGRGNSGGTTGAGTTASRTEGPTSSGTSPSSAMEKSDTAEKSSSAGKASSGAV